MKGKRSIRLLSIVCAVVMAISVCPSAVYATSALTTVEKKDVTKSMKKKKKVKALVQDVNNWCGINSYDKKSLKKLSGASRAEIAGTIIGQNMEYAPTDRYPDDFYTITKAQFQKKTSDLFARKVATKYIPKKTKREGMIYRYSEDNKICITLGDWGMSHPTYTITKVMQITDKTAKKVSYQVSFTTYMEDVVTPMSMKEPGEKTLVSKNVMTIEKNTASGYGYIITAMQVVNKMK